MVYRNFVRPDALRADGRPWTTLDWRQWLQAQVVAPSVRPSAGEDGVCRLCHGPTTLDQYGTW